MSFIPEGAEWYLADLVLEHAIEGDQRKLVHINTHLIRAKAPEQAYQKALTLGRAGRRTYRNTDGKQVRIRFRGLRQLNVIHEPLEDGAELMYAESIVTPGHDLRRWITPKRKLAVFAPLSVPADGPNYFPEAVLHVLERALDEKTASLQKRCKRRR